MWKKTAVKHTHTGVKRESLHFIHCHRPIPCTGTPDILDNTVTAWGCAQFVITVDLCVVCVCVCVCCGWPIDKWS